mmetsp:Transcript_24767/g.36330  ORF Transcript_24767/g.36330 Transcript_24767/m.36330 type:complete len:244 (+) Transcript_24767:56-787(+)|eukprot:CAMPEP_0195532344 /NCGR_PEP_ID=MMETSP0794_2-20130614/37844_1 /TAXON_ID=515487 /ORGANISM="Stephanopyxis turris, Strain CCMP 815" /LENGTH=243 /DNA_ID=CAMNT_0040664511 /DNA_START=36 /DNA_END=767 /DNA_ORIENTATION=+
MTNKAAILAAITVLSTTSSGANAFAFKARSQSKLLKPAVVASDETDGKNVMGKMAAAAALSLSILTTTATPAFADGQTKDFRLPPIDFNDKSRCKLNSSAMGQANAARDKLYDLRQCNLSGKDATGFDLSGVIMTKTDLSNSILREAQFSKGYLHDSNFEGADFTNGIVDRASFKGSSLKGAVFVNTVLTGTSFEGADVENADFTDSYIGDFDIRVLCKNPTLKGENPATGADTKLSVGCGAR